MDSLTPLPRALPGLTGIRGVAAVWVVCFHSFAILGLNVPAILPLVQRGWSGVDLFFVLSGFILMHAHASEFERIGGASLRRFAWLRFSRVYPLNLVTLCLIAVLVLPDPQFGKDLSDNSIGPFTAEAFVRTALLGTQFLPGMGSWNQPVWSLSAEIVGYAWFPLIAFGLSRLRGMTALALAAASFASLAAFHVVAGEVGQNLLTPGSTLPRMMFDFVGGAALYRARLVIGPGLGAWPGWMAGAAVVLIVGCAFSTPGAEAMPALYGVLIFALSYQRGLMHRLFSSRVAGFLGAISFPLYLIHVVGLFWLQHLFRLGVIGWSRPIILLWVGLLVGLATVLHRVIEVPIQRAARQRAGRSPVRV